MKKAFHIALLFLLLGCGGTLKKSWIDFRAYYNTYYIAKENYQAGLDQVESQSIQINVNKPIRIHRPPVGTGDKQFQKAIDKGAQILRKFPDSRWIDETLELIGKSYYYRQEFYSALQKFEEQYNVTDSDELRQRAVIWKGRVLLDLELHDEGVAYLQSELSNLSGKWKPHLRARAEVMLAEHNVQLQQWEKVTPLLRKAVTDLSVGSLKARTHFLLGQILEIEERYGEAAFAYGEAANNRPGFELLYWSNYKQAEALRKMGNLEEALAIYEQMRKDDKNVERLPEIRFEIARSEEAMGNIDTAERIFKQILRNKSYQVPQNIQADIYYRLGKIHSEYRKKHKLAAAYYDSSSSMRRDTEAKGILDEDLNTETLAKAYGRYSELRDQINHLDSLLWLGTLPEQKFDSVIAEVKSRKLKEMRQQSQKRKNSADVLTNVNAQQASGDATPNSGAYGFLNHKNSRLLTEARIRFQAIWGNRALVDNWRRIEAVRSSVRRQPETEEDITEAASLPEERQASPVKIDLSDIPFTKEEQEKTRNAIGTAHFELGNLFLLTLQNPDSASSYFRTFLEQHPSHKLVPKALYSLYELHDSEGEEQMARHWAMRLRREYPESRYTAQLQRGRSSTQTSNSTEQVLSRKADSILSSGASAGQITEKLRQLSLANKDTLAASQIHYESIRRYIRLAKEQEKLSQKLAAVDYFSADSILFIPELPEQPYEGMYWDSVRSVLKEHVENFADDPSAQKVAILSDELDKTDESEQKKADLLPTCQKVGLEPKIRGGMNNFLNKVIFPEELKDTNLSGTLEYEMTIAVNGSVESFELVSPQTKLGIEERFAKAIEEYLVFMPFQLDQNISKLRCRITFPIKR